jgi:hypothetical protein
LSLFADPDEAAEVAPVAEAPAALPRLPAARRAMVVAWLRKRLRIVAAIRHEAYGPLAGPVLYADAVRLVQGRRDLAGFDVEFIAEAFRGPV